MGSYYRSSNSYKRCSCHDSHKPSKPAYGTFWKTEFITVPFGWFFPIIERNPLFHYSVNLINIKNCRPLLTQGFGNFHIKIYSLLLLHINRLNNRTIIRFSFFIYPFYIHRNVIYPWLLYVLQSTCKCICINIL